MLGAATAFRSMSDSWSQQMIFRPSILAEDSPTNLSDIMVAKRLVWDSWATRRHNQRLAMVAVSDASAFKRRNRQSESEALE